MGKPAVKVCCISSLTEANMALDAGADYLGLVSEMPSGPGVISLQEIALIVHELPPETKTILLSSEQLAEDIIHQHNQVSTWGLQLVDRISNSELKKLRKLRPKTHLIQVVHVQNRTAVSEALSYENLVDFLLLDSGHPDAIIRTLGGTGETHDWRLSREICSRSSLPVFLAGGLSADNVEEAIASVHPCGIDLCSRLRTNGNLDQNKLDVFMGRLNQLKRNTT